MNEGDCPETNRKKRISNKGELKKKTEKHMKKDRSLKYFWNERWRYGFECWLNEVW